MMTIVPCPNSGCRCVSRLAEDPLGRIFRCPRCSAKLPTIACTAADAGWTKVSAARAGNRDLVKVSRSQLSHHALLGSGEVRVGALGWEWEEDEDSQCGEFAASEDAYVAARFSGASGAYVGLSQSDSELLAPGSSILGTLGRFQLLGVLGEGRHARVYRAFDPLLERSLALKVTRPEVKGTPRALERFLGEARALARLRHPRIVPIFEAGQMGDAYYIAMGLIEGESLADRLTQGIPTPHEAATMAVEIAEALGYAHSQGVIHRDIKPANIRLDSRGSAHVMDFSVAYRTESSELVSLPPGSIVGTPAYLAPEQVENSQLQGSPASDQYSLGAVLYELLCGRPPFSGPPSYVLFHAVHVEPPSPHQVSSSIPSALAAICLKSLAKEPERRYGDCVELASDLRRWLEGKTPIASRRSWALSRG